MIKIVKELCLIGIAAVFFNACSSPGNKQAEGTSQQPIQSDQPVTDNVLNEFNAKISADSSNAHLYYLRSKYYVRLKKLGLAKDDAERSIMLDSTNASYYINLADIYFYRNETRQTYDVLLKCLSLMPDNKEANFKMGELQYYIKQYKQAIKYANKAYEIDTKDLKSNYLLGMILKETGDTNKAVSFFRNCIDIDPNYFDVYDQLGYIEKARNKPEALQYFNNALRINPEAITSLYGRALCYQYKNDFDNAIKDYTTITQLDPSFIDAYFNMGYIHQVNLKMYREAIKYYDQSLAIDTMFVKAIYNKGYCFEQLGDIGNAKTAYQRCIDLEPTFDKARESLKRVMR